MNCFSLRFFFSGSGRILLGALCVVFVLYNLSVGRSTGTAIKAISPLANHNNNNQNDDNNNHHHHIIINNNKNIASIQKESGGTCSTSKLDTGLVSWASSYNTTSTFTEYNATLHDFGEPCLNMLPSGGSSSRIISDDVASLKSHAHFIDHHFPGLARLTNVCVRNEGNVVMIPAGSPAVGELRHMQTSDPEHWLQLKYEVVPHRKMFPSTTNNNYFYHNISTLLLRTPHRRNIAHSFHDAFFVALYYLHRYVTPHNKRDLLLAHSYSQWLNQLPSDVFEKGLKSMPKRWSDGLLISAMLDKRIPIDALLPLKANQIHCFREMVYVGSTREGCTSRENCRSRHRKETLRWVHSLRKYSFPGFQVPAQEHNNNNNNNN
eukprot:PhM_4_TR16420/c1_g1_i2/m.58394